MRVDWDTAYLANERVIQEPEYPYVLSPELAVENLQTDVRDSARTYFDTHAISWWLSNDERTERKQLGIMEKLPTGHLNCLRSRA